MTFDEVIKAAQDHGMKFLFGIATGGLTLAYKRLSLKVKREKERNEASREAEMALLADRITQMHRHFSEKGYFPIDDRRNAERMVSAYTKLGGNGVILDLYGRLTALPLMNKEEVS